MPITLNFGGLEALLAMIHAIADNKRTAFQARLKNLHRLHFPIGFETAKGKASVYTPGHIVEIGLALEMTQLGIPPERIVHVLAMNRFPTFMAIRIAASNLRERPAGFDAERTLPTDPYSTFLYFDPAALSSLMIEDPKATPDIDFTDDTFFYAGAADVRENFVRWTSGNINRLSMINVTSLVDMLATGAAVNIGNDEQAIEFKAEFFKDVEKWAEEQVEKTYSEEASYYAGRILRQIVSDDELISSDAVANLSNQTGLLPETIAAAIAKLLEEDAADGNNS